jgi:hypothetical protein
MWELRRRRCGTHGRASRATACRSCPPRSALWLDWQRPAHRPDAAGHRLRHPRPGRPASAPTERQLLLAAAQHGASPIKELAVSGAEHNPSVRDKKKLRLPARPAVRQFTWLHEEMMAQACPDCRRRPRPRRNWRHRMNALQGDDCRQPRRHAPCRNGSLRRPDRPRRRPSTTTSSCAASPACGAGRATACAPASSRRSSIRGPARSSRSVSSSSAARAWAASRPTWKAACSTTPASRSPDCTPPARRPDSAAAACTACGRWRAASSAAASSAAGSPARPRRPPTEGPVHSSANGPAAGAAAALIKHRCSDLLGCLIRGSAIDPDDCQVRHFRPRPRVWHHPADDPLLDASMRVLIRSSS